MPRYHNINGEKVSFSAEEEAARDAEEAAWASASTDRAWDRVREKRDALLRDCDWTQAPDVANPRGGKPAWVIYRQALRDITGQPDPFNITWPDVPV